MRQRRDKLDPFCGPDVGADARDNKSRPLNTGALLPPQPYQPRNIARAASGRDTLVIPTMPPK